jgi:hypothetical protein
MCELVVVESPYGSRPDGDRASPAELEANVAYARAALGDCLKRGEAPFASHLLYTQPGVLDDSVREQRAIGMEAGFFWGAVADRVVVYTDRGITPGMDLGIRKAELRGQPVEYRTLPGWEGKAP